jgi:hypothetical protein
LGSASLEKIVVRGDFKVRSLEGIGTPAQDMDIGVIRVPSAMLRKLGTRNSLVRVSLMENGRKKKSLIRIVRAATGARALLKNEVALQYDDRRELGIYRAGSTHTLVIEPVHEWLALPSFLLGHSSPLVRRETVFALALMVVGAIIGFIVGLAF